MKPEFMRLRRAFAGTLAALLMAVGIVVLSPALSASAHHNTINASASCTNHVWTITWTITNSERDKSEEITSSTDQSIIATGDTIAADSTHTHTEVVSEPLEKTLTVSATWSNGQTNTASKKILPSDFQGTCQPLDQLNLSATASGCSAQSAETGTINFTLTGATTGYTVALLKGGSTVATTSSSGGAGQFTAVAPGTYTVSASAPGGSSTTSGPVTVDVCAQSTPDVSLALVPCRTLGILGPVTAELSSLAVGNSYTITLFTAADVELASQPLTATAATAVVEFPGHGPGDYYATVTDTGGLFTASANMTITKCPDPPTLAPPSVELLADQCDGSGTGIDVLTAQVIDLDATRTYFVRIVDSAGATAPGGDDRMVTGSTTATVEFPDVRAAGTYTAQLFINPGMQLAATSPAAADFSVCLPTLAMTGPGVLVPLGSVAALLLTLGGAVVTGRLRRRMAL